MRLHLGLIVPDIKPSSGLSNCVKIIPSISYLDINKNSFTCSINSSSVVASSIVKSQGVSNPYSSNSSNALPLLIESQYATKWACLNTQVLFKHVGI